MLFGDRFSRRFGNPFGSDLGPNLDPERHRRSSRKRTSKRRPTRNPETADFEQPSYVFVRFLAPTCVPKWIPKGPKNDANRIPPSRRKKGPDMNPKWPNLDPQMGSKIAPRWLQDGSQERSNFRSGLQCFWRDRGRDLGGRLGGLRGAVTRKTG